MANISYGVNLLPKTNNAYTLGNSDYKWSNIYTVQLNGINVEDLGTSDLATTTTPGLMSAADKAKLDTLSAFNATDYTVNIATTDWVNNSYTWTNSAVTSTAYIIVNFTESVKDYVKGTLDYTKVTGGVQFNVESTPTGTITLVIGVIDGASGTSASGGGADIDDTVTALNKTWSSSKIDEQVIISSTQPSTTSNKLWISNDTGTEVTVPTYSEFTTAINGKVDDVQVNGTSIVNNGIANLPIPDESNFGVVKIKDGGYYGLQALSTGYITTSPATDNQVKGGTEAWRLINPMRQHLSTFYGLAKAAGDSTQSASSNAVGNYTPEAKIAIQKMLGVYQQPWEFIREDTFTNATEADHTITLDANNEAFDLTDIIFMFETPKQETDAAKGSYGQIHFYYGTSDYFGSESGAWTQAANGSAHGFVVRIVQEPGGMFWCQETSQTTSSNSAPWRTRYYSTFKTGSQGLRMLENNYVRHITKIVIKTVTGTGHYLLYGKRALT